jgi:filamentous hemagglutinin
LGGLQGGQGEFFTVPYSPGSGMDYICEAYAGPHDFLNSWAYDPATGNLRNLNAFENLVGKVTNPLNVVLATPFAATMMIPRSTIPPPVLIYSNSREN